MAKEARRLTGELVGEMSVSLSGRRLSAADAAAVAGLLNALDAEIEVCRSMDLGDDEPAMIYLALEGER